MEGIGEVGNVRAVSARTPESYPVFAALIVAVVIPLLREARVRTAAPGVPEVGSRGGAWNPPGRCKGGAQERG